MATHSSVLAWRIPGTGEPGGLPSVGSHRVGHGWSNLVVVVVIHWVLCSRDNFSKKQITLHQSPLLLLLKQLLQATAKVLPSPGSNPPHLLQHAELPLPTTENLHRGQQCLNTSSQSNLGHFNGLWGKQDKIFEIGVILDNSGKPEHMIPTTMAQRARTDSLAITSGLDKRVEYLPNVLIPASLLQKTLCDFSDTFFCLLQAFPRKYYLSFGIILSWFKTWSKTCNLVLSYKGQVTRLLWALNSLGLRERNEHSLPHCIVVLIKWDIYLLIHPNLLIVSFCQFILLELYILGYTGKLLLDSSHFIRSFFFF